MAATINQIFGLVAALGSKISSSTLADDKSVLVAQTSGVPDRVALAPNSLLVRQTSNITSLNLAEDSVVARVTGGNIGALSFSALKSALAIGATDLPLTEDNILVGNVSGMAAEVPLSSISLSSLGAPTADIDLGTFTFKSSKVTPTGTDLVSADYVTSVLSSYVPPIPSISSLNLATGQIIVGDNLGKASAVAKSTIKLNELGVPTTTVDLGSQTLTTTKTTGFLDDHLVTKKYVDDAIVAAPVPSLVGQTLTNGTILVGNVSNDAAEVVLSSIKLNTFAAPDASVSFPKGLSSDLAPTLGSHVTNKDYVDTQISTVTSAIASAGTKAHVGAATTGSMTLTTLPVTPTTVLAVFYRSELLELTTEYTVSGMNIVATSGLNVAYGGTASDGNGFVTADKITVLYI